METERILVADDEERIRKVFRNLLTSEGYETIEAGDGIKSLELIKSEKPLMVFLDIDMPEMDGLTVLDKLREEGIDTPVIVMTGFSSMETAIRAVRSGAYEYMAKPLDFQKVIVLIQRCLEEQRLRSEIERLREKLPDDADRYELIGSSPPMLDIYKAIGSIAGTPNTTNVLILGESGTGKELVARQIHQWGSKTEKPFLPLNMTALPDNLLESELFGYERGAFTGANQRKRGKFELAQDGTIFLDEIGDLSPDLQQKLLRVIQEREFVRLGGHETIEVQARFIAATHADLEKKVNDGKFRQDLYFRLNVVNVEIPPLRERSEDIPLLVQHFAEKAATQMGKKEWHLPPEMIERFMGHNWPGNVRELENSIARALVMIPGEHMEPIGKSVSKSKSSPFDPPVVHKKLKDARKAVVQILEQKFIKIRLQETKGNVTKAAEIAGITRQSFQRMMQKYKIRSQDFK